MDATKPRGSLLCSVWLPQAPPFRYLSRNFATPLRAQRDPVEDLRGLLPAHSHLLYTSCGIKQGPWAKLTSPTGTVPEACSKILINNRRKSKLWKQNDSSIHNVNIHICYHKI